MVKKIIIDIRTSKKGFDISVDDLKFFVATNHKNLKRLAKIDKLQRKLDKMEKDSAGSEESLKSAAQKTIVSHTLGFLAYDKLMSRYKDSDIVLDIVTKINLAIARELNNKQESVSYER